MRIVHKVSFCLALLVSPTLAFAAKGEVVHYKSGCSYFIVETPMGYSILEWYGGYDPSKGDVIAGNFESFGFKDVYNVSADHETKVWVEDFWLSRQSAVEKYSRKCP